MGCFKKINAFPVFSKCFHKTVHNKWCLDKIVGQIENDLECGFVKTKPFHNEFFWQKLLDNPPSVCFLEFFGALFTTLLIKAQNVHVIRPCLD